MNGDPHERIHGHDLFRQRLHNPAFWERLWRAAGIESVLCFIVAYIVYDHQPHVGASAYALADTGQDGWRGAATASSAALGALFLLLIAVVAALAYSIAGSGNHMLTIAQTTSWAGFVLTLFPRAMLIMAGRLTWISQRVLNIILKASVAFGLLAA